MTEHRICEEWYCDPTKVKDPELIEQLLKEGPHCEFCGHDWPCPWVREEVTDA